MGFNDIIVYIGRVFMSEQNKIILIRELILGLPCHSTVGYAVRNL